MIELPKHITRTVLRVGNNLIRRCYGQEDVCLNNTSRSIITRNPFVVEEDGRRIFFTSNPTATVPDNCPYAILVNRSPTPKLFCDGTFKSYEWLKHPFINDVLTPDEIVFLWRGKFTYLEKDDVTNSPGSKQVHLLLKRQIQHCRWGLFYGRDIFAKPFLSSAFSASNSLIRPSSHTTPDIARIISLPQYI